MDPITDLIYAVAKELGIPRSTTVFVLLMAIMVANRIARLIPDTATGPLKYVRLVAKFIGMHVKDNSGVAAILTPGGEAIRRADPESIPEDLQGALELSNEDKLSPFKLANDALNRRANP